MNLKGVMGGKARKKEKALLVFFKAGGKQPSIESKK